MSNGLCDFVCSLKSTGGESVTHYEKQIHSLGNESLPDWKIPVDDSGKLIENTGYVIERHCQRHGTYALQREGKQTLCQLPPYYCQFQGNNEAANEQGKLPRCMYRPNMS